MVEVVTMQNQHQYKSKLEQMYRQRYKVFVEQLHWDLPYAKDGLEIDQYDTEYTIYLLSLDENGDVQGSKRLNPTIKPHLLSDIFSHLVEGEIPRGPHIWESSRSCIRPDKRDSGVIGELFVAMVEVGLLLEIQQITFVCDMTFYPTILQAGWGITPLGFFKRHNDGNDNIAGCVSINPVALHNLRQKHQISKTMLNSLPLGNVA